jgi:pimeloyl-ACP methyl ester carboxylesterase
MDINRPVRMKTLNTRMVLLPGIGSDERLFESQHRVFPNLTVPKWIDPLAGEPLSSYAEHFARRLNIRRPFIIGGVSFGGMVALEMARHLKPQAVLLIASSQNSDFLPPPAKFLISKFPLLLKAMLSLARRFPSILLSPFRVKNNEHRGIFVEMYRAASRDFIFWAINAMNGWEGVERKKTKIFHVHGARDFLIPLKKVKPDKVVLDGGHLINLTHSREVNLLIKGYLRKLK